MDTFLVIIQIIFVWFLLIAKTGLFAAIYSKQKERGWLLLAVAGGLDLFNKIIVMASSFWIREQVSMYNLGNFGLMTNIVSTILNIITYGLAVYGVFLLYSAYKRNVGAPISPAIPATRIPPQPQGYQPAQQVVQTPGQPQPRVQQPPRPPQQAAPQPGQPQQVVQ